MANSLARHLLQSASHDHLAFHPGCAVCRDSRLAGRIINHPLVPRSMRAGVAAAVIGASALATNVKTAAPAQAQQPKDKKPADRSPPAVSPEELDKKLADPNKADPKPAPRSAQGPRGSVLVRSGDSLWTIADDQLGGDPTAAQIAKEVDRLWTLNAKSIGTGNRDLILPGQRLRLR